MTSVMLASYPEVFAGGAIIAGLPLWHRQQCPRSARRHDAVDIAPRRQYWAISSARPPSTRGRGRKCRCGTAAPIAP
jgi:poly(3-hydroxybutyrate) depolymerase